MIYQGLDVIGVINLSWGDYAMLCRTILMSVKNVAHEEIRKTMNEQIWKHSLNQFKDEEKAKNKLIESGWNAEVIDRYSLAIAAELSQRLADFLPEA